MEERIQKILARAGLGSRRACEELISTGRVKVNNRIAQLGDKADIRRDQVMVDGRILEKPEALVYIALHKPRGVISSVEEEFGRTTVLDLVPVETRLYPVGRLDFDSEGLILLTNDGELANRLTHPRYGHEKEYRVLVARRPDEAQLQAWRRGLVLPDGYRTAPADVQLSTPSGKGIWLRVVMREGRKRQIREIGATIGLPVVRILRTRIGSLQLGSLKPRQWRYLTEKEVIGLQEGEDRPGKPHSGPIANRPRTSHSGGRVSTGKTMRRVPPGKGKPTIGVSSGKLRRSGKRAQRHSANNVSPANSDSKKPLRPRPK